MVLPNFFVIGASSGGSTSLYSYLKQHPQIFMSPNKEPHFFADKKGPGVIGYKKIKIDTLEKYEALFDGVTNEKAIGEASVSYLYCPNTPSRIIDMVPDAKFVAILRDPVDRAYSNFKRCVWKNQDTVKTFEEALALEPTRIEEDGCPFVWLYKNKGFYYGQLKRYFDAVGQDRVKVFLSEDLRSQPQKVSSELFDFLDVDSQFIPDFSKKENVSSIPKNKFLHNLSTQSNPVKSVFKSLIPENIAVGMREKVKTLNRSQTKPSDEMRKRLVSDYREDILKLQDLIQRDLSNWLEC